MRKARRVIPPGALRIRRRFLPMPNSWKRYGSRERWSRFLPQYGAIEGITALRISNEDGLNIVLPQASILKSRNKVT
jgi:hypothetical protein